MHDGLGNRTRVVRLLVFALIALLAAPAAACRCAPLTLEGYYRDADIVFLADIVAVATVESDGDSGYRNAQFRIGEAFKGVAGLRHIRTPISGAACGISIKAGERYWVFARRRPGEPDAWIDSCNGSRRSGSHYVDVEASDVARRLRTLAAADAQADVPQPFTDPACWKKPRRFHVGAPPADVAQNITLERVEKRRGDFDGRTSPNGAYAFAIEVTPGTDPQSRIATLTAESERDDRLQLRLHGVAAPPQAEWINEKLILVRVAWDSQLSTDLILDVEAEKLIYSEAARSGEQLFEHPRAACEQR